MDPPYPIIKPAPRTGQSKLIVADMPAIDHHWAEPAPAVYPAQSKQPAGDGGWHWTMEEATSWAGTHGHIETLKMLAVDWERQVRALSTLVHARQPQLPSRERLRSIQRSPPRDTRPGSCRKRLPGATLRPLHEYPPLRAAFPRPFRLQSPPSHPQPAHRTPLTTSHERSCNQSYFATIPFRAVIRPIRA